MIRRLRLPMALLNAWLVSQSLDHVSSTAAYKLRLWKENRAKLSDIKNDLIAYVNEALEDARKHLRRGFEDPLSSYVDPSIDPAMHYPAILHQITLQGYLGELLGGIATEHWGSHGLNDWLIPAYLFRTHEVEFQHLESINQKLAAGEAYAADSERAQRPGRTGDDVVAFRMNSDNQIVGILTIEAKCVGTHKSQIVSDAHEKLSEGLDIPVSVRELINLLADYDTPDANKWRQALLALRSGVHTARQRYDAVSYASSTHPKQNSRQSWLPTDSEHESYKGKRKLEAFEFHLDDLKSAIGIIFRDE